MKTRLAALIALAVILTLALATTAGAKPQSLDSYCSPTGDFCQEVTLSKSGIVKFALTTFSFSGEYTICVKGSTASTARISSSTSGATLTPTRSTGSATSLTSPAPTE